MQGAFCFSLANFYYLPHYYHLVETQEVQFILYNIAVKCYGSVYDVDVDVLSVKQTQSNGLFRSFSQLDPSRSVPNSLQFCFGYSHL